MSESYMYVNITVLTRFIHPST